MKLSIFYRSMSLEKGYLQKDTTIRVYSMQNGRNVLLAEATFDLAPLVGKREQQVTLPLIYGKVEIGRLGAFISII